MKRAGGPARASSLARLKALAIRKPRFRFGFSPPTLVRDRYVRVLPFRRSWPVIIITGAFFAVFAVPLFVVPSAFGGAGDDSLFSFVFSAFAAFWLLGWSVGVIILGLIFVAVAFAREVVIATRDALTMRIDVFGFYVGAEFEAAHIDAFRAESGDVVNGNAWRGRHVIFEYCGEPVALGSALDGESSRLLIRELERALQTGVRRPDRGHAQVAQVADATPVDNAPVDDAPVDVDSGTSAAAPVTLGSVSTVALIAANLVPVVGAIFLDWSIGEIMLLFWAESAIIGVFNLAKMARVGGWTVLFMGPFFVGHYGGFMVGHLLFIYALFMGGMTENAALPTTGDVVAEFIQLWPALIALTISHAISFQLNFVGRREYAGRDLGAQMKQPYGRIIVMHVTIILGGFLALAMSSALPALIMLVALKLAADVRGHLREHR